ncbi:MAG: adenylate/guanylate cyclase domain-containing protein, partial [Polyangia bacterium]
MHDPATPAPTSLVDRLVGSPSQFPLEHRLLTACCLVALVGCLIVSPLNFYLHLDATQSLIVLGFGLTQIAFYYALRVKHRYRAVLLPELLLAAALFVYLWICCGGSRGGAQYFFFVGITVPVLLAGGWLRVVLSVAFLALIATLFAVEYVHPEWVPDPYHSRAVRYLDMSASFLFAVGLLTAVILVLTRNYGDALELLERERAKSDWLLHNVLPRTVSDRLKLSPGVIADRFDDVTVLFADIVGFTGRSSAMPAQEVVAMLNKVFSRFDAL